MFRTIRTSFRFFIVLSFVLIAPGQIARSGANEAIPQDNLGVKTLLTFCRGSGGTDAGLCNGYILAIAEAMNAGQTLYGQKTCNTQGIRAQELTDMVRQSLHETPAQQLQTQKAGPMIAAVLARAYSCHNAEDDSPILDRRVTSEPLTAPPLRER